jgi:N-acetyl-1-D-myo-inositol-2-amino-2-deoxy-alpha-D-glucopyranoside deacetylase
VTAAWSGRRLLLVVAHPDDETFGCGSVIAGAAAGGADVTVCCATRGEAGELVAGCELGAGTLADLRVRELHEAGQVLGVRHFELLDFVDSGMEGEAGVDTLVGAPLEAVVDAVGQVIERTDPDVVVTLDPTGGDGHRDHIRIAEATTEAVRRQPTGASLYHWCIPRSVLLRWLERTREVNPDSGHLDLDRSGLGRPSEDITTVLDHAEHLDLRRQAIARHASQRSPFEDMPDDLIHDFLARDHLVRAEPSWSGGPQEAALLIPDRR